jgi:hypothetical protein
VLIAGREVGICDARVCDPVLLERNDQRFRPCLDGSYCLPGTLGGMPSQSTCLGMEGAGGPGAACTQDTQCNSGLGCYVQGMIGQCTAWCRTEVDCPAGSVCVLVQSASGQPFQAVPQDELGLCEPGMGS